MKAGVDRAEAAGAPCHWKSRPASAHEMLSEEFWHGMRRVEGRPFLGIGFRIPDYRLRFQKAGYQADIYTRCPLEDHSSTS